MATSVPLNPPEQAHQQHSSRLTFSERSLSPATVGTRGTSWARSYNESPSPGPSTSRTRRSPSSNRATSRTRLFLPYSNTRESPPGADRINQNGTAGNQDRSSSKFRKAATDWKLQTRKDIRTRLPKFLQRFSGWRDPSTSPPYEPLPFPPFSWLKKIPLKYEVWLLSTIGAFVGIALIEVVIAASFPNDGTILIVASFGATAVLVFSTIESPLAQPRHAIGGQVVSVLVGVALNRLFRKSPHYRLDETIQPGELDNIVWINGALSMSLSLLVMQITGTVHPPGGATAIIASVQPAAVEMSWRLVYVVIIASIVMTAWALLINNVGRRRYPSYWLSGSKTFVVPRGDKGTELATLDEVEMAAEEGMTDLLSPSGHQRANMFELQEVPEESSMEERRGRSELPITSRGR